MTLRILAVGDVVGKAGLSHLAATLNTQKQNLGVDLCIVNGENASEIKGICRADAEQLLTDNGYTFPVYFDTNMECAYGYGVSGIPMTFFIDKEGNLISGKSGMISEDDLDRRIQTILG